MTWHITVHVHKVETHSTVSPDTETQPRVLATVSRV